jgi:2-C-methyl-D-erythritol 4-phosphate cytidylyltransferase/2-C-methyl-D-erythritol 2,4-cyclodiphosphate synthase
VRVAVIVVAAGSGTRLGLATPKAFVELDGQSLLERTVRSVAQSANDAQIIAVVPVDLVDVAGEILAGALGASTGSSGAGDSGHTWSVIAGGVMRHDSVALGLGAVNEGVDVVLVHDAARALTPPHVFEDVARAVQSTGNGIVASLPVIDTIKLVDADGAVVSDVDRATLAAMQTPQGFPRVELERAYSDAAHSNFTDDAAVFTAAGYRVCTIAGDSASFKITTPDDLHRARLLLDADASANALRVAGAIDADARFRVGTGVDTHAFSDDPQVALTLAGLEWPGERGLAGHSDGDAVAHAVCDALLSAAGLGDIGTVFGTDDPRFSGASGDIFVTHAVSLVREAGYEPVNVTVQIVGNRPRLAGRRAEAESVLTAWVGAPVSVSATTTDGLGFTGRGEGVAAIATALIRARR